MKSFSKTTSELIEDEADARKSNRQRLCPLPLSVIPNYMGINLCSVERVSWAKQDDDQLVSLTVHFIPE